MIAISQTFQFLAGIIIFFMSLIVVDWLMSFTLSEEERTNTARGMEIFLYGDCDF